MLEILNLIRSAMRDWQERARLPLLKEDLLWLEASRSDRRIGG